MKNYNTPKKYPNQPEPDRGFLLIVVIGLFAALIASKNCSGAGYKNKLEQQNQTELFDNNKK